MLQGKRSFVLHSGMERRERASIIWNLFGSVPKLDAHTYKIIPHMSNIRQAENRYRNQQNTPVPMVIISVFNKEFHCAVRVV